MASDLKDDLSNLPLSEAALWYAAQGFHVIPCKPKDKVPLVHWKEYQEKAPNEFDINSWWSLWPDANIAIILGRGLIAVDVDGPEGHEALKRAGVAFPAETPMSMTGRGVHYLLRGECDDRIGLLPKVDIRGKGIIVVPPSVHASGRRYQWLRPPDALVPDIPAALQDLISSPQLAQDPSAPSGPDWVTQALQGVGEGLRNVTCTRLAGYFLAKGVTPEAVTVMLMDWAKRCRPPLPANEVHLCVESIADREGPHDDDPKSLTESLVSVGDLYATAPDQHEWIVEDYIPRGSLVMLASEEKVGKSTLTYAMVAAIVRGRPFLNRTTEKVPVLMLAVEEHQTDVKMRSIKFGMKPDDPVRFYFGDLTSDDATYRSLRDAVKSTGAGLVVLDTLGHHLADVLESENDNQQMIKAVKPWLRLARDTHAAVLIIHHAGKTGAAYRGASGLGGIVDQILTLRHGGENMRGIESRGRYEQTPRYLRIKLEGTEYHVI